MAECILQPSAVAQTPFMKFAFTLSAASASEAPPESTQVKASAAAKAVAGVRMARLSLLNVIAARLLITRLWPYQLRPAPCSRGRSGENSRGSQAQTGSTRER